MIVFIDPFSVVIVGDRAFNAERVDGNLFGGFCKCGGIMFQKAWIDNTVMISECEKCWNVEAFMFNGRKLIERCEVKVIYRRNLYDFLREYLSPSEFEAILDKAMDGHYNYNAYSRAKKKLEDLKLNVDEIINILRETV